MNTYIKERLDMIKAMASAITGLSIEETYKNIRSTYIYQDIIDENELALYDSYSANLLDIADELKTRDEKTEFVRITPHTISDLNQWMDDNNIYAPEGILQNYHPKRDIIDNIERATELIRNMIDTISGDIRGKVSQWLDSTNKILKDNWFEDLFASFTPFLITEATVRGDDCEKFNTSFNIEVLQIADGVCLFKIENAVSCRLSFTIPDIDAPLFLAIMDKDSSKLIGVYSFNKLGSRMLRTNEEISLNAGEYIMFVAIDKKE